MALDGSKGPILKWPPATQVNSESAISSAFRVMTMGIVGFAIMQNSNSTF